MPKTNTERARQFYEYIASRPDGVPAREMREKCHIHVSILLTLLNENGFMVYTATDESGKLRIHAWKEVDRTVRPQKSFPNYWSTNFLNIPANAKD